MVEKLTALPSNKNTKSSQHLCDNIASAFRNKVNGIYDTFEAAITNKSVKESWITETRVNVFQNFSELSSELE